MALTGRFFRCLSLKGEESVQAEAFFKVNEIYEESDIDMFEGNICDETMFLLHSNVRVAMYNPDGSVEMYRPAFYVSAMDFEEVVGVKNLCLN